MKVKENIALEFNEFSKNYTHDMTACVPHYLNLLNSFTEYLPENFSPKNLLDLGCGNGNVTARLLKYFPSANYTLVDASEEMLDICKSQFKNYDIEYVQVYFKDFFFEKNKYDLITAGFSLHHCEAEEKKYLFKKINTALNTGGFFSYSDMMISRSNPDHAPLLKEWEIFVNRSFPNGEKWKWLMEHYTAFDRPDNYFDQVEWMEAAGFKNIRFPFKEGYWRHLQAVK